MTATATQTQTQSQSTTDRYKWTEDENTALVNDFDSTEPRSDERKAAMQKWADKSGASFDSVIARVYAIKAKRGTPAGQPRGTSVARSGAAAIEKMEAQREALNERIQRDRENSKNLTVRINEAKKGLAKREKEQAKKVADDLAKAQARVAEAEAKLAALTA